MNNLIIDQEIIYIDFEDETKGRSDRPKKNMAVAARRFRRVLVDLVNGRRGEC